MVINFKYDFVLSFAGEDRDNVEKVRDCLLEQNVRVFYDYDEQHKLLGKDLTEHFSELYHSAARFCVMFLSKAYLDKIWCKWERRAALARALESSREYIIPYYLEDVTITSIPKTIGHTTLANNPPKAFSLLLLKKLDEVRRQSDSLIDYSLFQNLDVEPNGSKISDLDNVEITTQYHNLDKLLNRPLQPGSLYGIGGRPFSGRTTLALNMALRMAKQGIPVAYITGLLPCTTIMTRILAIQSGVSVDKIGREKLSITEIEQLDNAHRSLKDIPLYFYDAGSIMSPEKAICTIWGGIKNSGIKVFFVDDIHLFRNTEFFGTSNSIGQTGTLKAFKWIAQQTLTTGFGVVKLKRNTEIRTNKMPTILDVRGGNSTTRIFDAMYLLYREGMYNEEKFESGLTIFFGQAPDFKKRSPVKLELNPDSGYIDDDYFYDYDWDDFSEI